MMSTSTGQAAVSHGVPLFTVFDVERTAGHVVSQTRPDRRRTFEAECSHTGSPDIRRVTQVSLQLTTLLITTGSVRSSIFSRPY